MARGFVPVERDQRFLLPVDMREWLPADHEALFVVGLVEELDVSAFERVYRLGGAGRRAYDPRMMVGLLLYAYSQGVESSRAIERACRESIAFRVVCGGLVPDHSAIARFRAVHESRFAELFVQVLVMARDLGLVRLGVLAVDGTKISANASAEANRTREGLEAAVAEILARHRANDEAEDARHGDARGDELPEDLVNPEQRQARLREALRRVKEREAKRDAPGRGASKANMTDPESALMHTAAQGFVQGYNAQVAVGEGRLVLAVRVTDEANDYHQLRPVLAEVEANLSGAGLDGRVGTVVADAEYLSAENLELAEEEQRAEGGKKILIATKKRRGSRPVRGETGSSPEELLARHRQEVAEFEAARESERQRRAEVFARVDARRLGQSEAAATLGLSSGGFKIAYRTWRRDGTVPLPRQAAPAAPNLFPVRKHLMEQALDRPENRTAYRQRAPLAEGAISSLKRRGAQSRFLRRGLTAVTAEWTIRATVHNIGKLRQARPATA